MATFDALRDVSAILKSVIDAGLSVIPTATCEVHDLLTTPAAMTVTLTPYEIAEDASSRNKADIRIVSNHVVTTQRPPAALLVRYLVAAWSGKIEDDQRLLGRVIQTLYDNAIITGPALNGTSLNPTDESVIVTMIQQSIEDRTHVWRAFDKPYRLSVNYEVRVVKIASERTRTAAQVKSRHLRHGVIEETP
jgi:hypothetical protein